MRLQISDDAVRQNVETFLQILHRVEEKQAQKLLPPELEFRAWLNRETGQLFFAEIAEETRNLEKEGKPVVLGYRYNPAKGNIEFLINDAGENRQVFQSADLTPAAWNTLEKTLKVIGEISQKLQGPSDLNTKVSVLSKLVITAGVPYGDRNMIVDLWHPADRMEAEVLLVGKPHGTYFFRKDPYAEILQQQLEREHSKTIKCFTLTCSQEGRKVSDYTIVHVDGSWQIYNDDPSLETPRFLELKDVVKSFSDSLKYPLYRNES